MPQARALLARCGGALHHVHCTEDGRVSYRPYRETSQALMRLLRRFVNAAVVERASIDEAYVLCKPPAALAATYSGRAVPPVAGRSI